jgi:hypothetical protein
LAARHQDWLPWLRAFVAVGGVGATVLLLVSGKLAPWAARGAAGVAIVACAAAPTAYTMATAATPQHGSIPTVGPPRTGTSGGMFMTGGLLDSPQPGPAVSAMLADRADEYTWAAAIIGSNNAAGYQLASGAPVLAIGGFNGTDPSPTLAQFTDDVAAGRIHYFIRGPLMIGQWGASTGGSHQASDIAKWVETHYTPLIVERAVVYDLTQTPRNS